MTDTCMPERAVSREDRAFISLPMARVLRDDMAWWLAGAVISYIAAYVILMGWPLRLPLNAPFLYGGDGFSHGWMVQRVMEGWIFDNPRSGYPFGSAFYDYPGADGGNLLIAKVLGWTVGTWYGALNLYILLGFPTAFISAYGVARSLGLTKSGAFAMALLFAMAPYHFARFSYGHLFYTWYFVVPIYLYYGIRLALSDPRMLVGGWRTHGVHILVMAICACFGVYFAWFGAIAIGLGALLATIRHASWRPWLIVAVLGAGIVVGTLGNLAPSLVYTHMHGPNPEVAVRLPSETEVFGLKITHMVLPTPMHRVRSMAAVTTTYQHDFPLSNSTSSLGVAGVIGLLAMFGYLLAGAMARPPSPLVGAFAGIVLGLLLVSTVGGFSSLFALFVSSLIRGWDRASIFIMYAALFIFFLGLDRARWSRLSVPWASVARIVVVVVVTALAFLDQTPRSLKPITTSAKQAFLVDHEFIGKLEQRLPEGAAIYQLPYMSFPEGVQVGGIPGYVPLAGVLNSRTLKWSFGGVRGREGDQFFRQLANEPMARQVDVARSKGFSGIYLDLRGYPEGGKAALEELTQALGHGPDLMRNDGLVAFFSLESGQGS